MSEQIRISAKNLGAIALPEFCARCFWIKLKVEQLPFQIFPGIFSSIDAYSKRVIHGWFDSQGTAPLWLADLGEVTGYIQPPHHSKFSIVDREFNIKLTGAPDGILVKSDSSHIIVDYKTAKFTEAHDRLLPMYEVQLNGYALIGEQTGLSPISGLALIYTEPLTDDYEAVKTDVVTEHGFKMNFSAKILQVPLKLEMIRPLLATTREIYDQKKAPDGTVGCKDCHLLNDLVLLIR